MQQSGALAARDLLDAFDRLDTSRNGRISARELDAAIQDPNVKGELADAVVTLRAKMKAAENGIAGSERAYFNFGLGILKVDALNLFAGAHRLFTSTALTRADLERLASGEGDPKDIAALNKAFELVRERRTATASDVFAATGPSSAQVHQGSVGDCVFDAAACGLAHQRPDELRRLFTAADNGGHFVRLGGKTLTVSPLTDGEKSYLATTGSGGQWLALAAKAYGQLRAGEGATSKALNAGEGAALNFGIKAITGHDSTNHLPLFMSTGALRSVVRDALERKRVIVAGAYFDTNSVHRGHAYSVLAYDEAADQVTIRNPYGNNKGLTGRGVREDGTVVMSMRRFDATFQIVAVEHDS
jgi:hypothetical protein